ncbi:MAG: DNA repair protein RadC [Dokdonella sp.]|uniref:RadC family protein n=1 Tax=Dokdonella sp. TaxID=2291710 RepID=UPI001B5F17B3|nr:DNA repair protein RadC [Dokdonella sp.]MCC6439235.1 DNA repair protein RadC [Rhodanobacteraceae bacterium]MBK8123540.1 DNA repair protein RadC [Dokdonella sp.]MBP6326989.1 DNA repair protein RadC [Dokdonella sp.]MBP6329458.1 DNA repair protein RadC [Dokdonella sp.]HNV09154.1 DNA repair protein RadC [Dokdonella sp.]
MSIRDWPDGERPREKLRMRGSGSLSDAELLAVFIGSGRRGSSAVDMGRELLSGRGGLKGLLHAPQKRSGLGPVAWCRLQAALELGRRYLDSELQEIPSLTDPASSARYLKSRLAAYPYEVFACLFLDNRHRVIAFEELFRGTIDGASVHPREVVRHCLAHNAAAVILAHNHPSGVSEPSAADRAITLRLRDALALIDVRVLDHFVIGDGVPSSLAQRGWI